MSTTTPLTDRKHFKVHGSVFAAVFTAWRNMHEHAAATSALGEHGDDLSDGTRFYIDGLSGYGIRPDGELVFVHSFVRGQGDRVVASAVENGAVYLDCFDGYLTGLYARHGFQEVRRDANWTPGGPDVVYMALPGYADRHGASEPIGGPIRVGDRVIIVSQESDHFGATGTASHVESHHVTVRIDGRNGAGIIFQRERVAPLPSDPAATVLDNIAALLRGNPWDHLPDSDRRLVTALRSLVGTTGRAATP